MDYLAFALKLEHAVVHTNKQTIVHNILIAKKLIAHRSRQVTNNTQRDGEIDSQRGGREKWGKRQARKNGTRGQRMARASRFIVPQRHLTAGSVTDTELLP